MSDASISKTSVTDYSRMNHEDIEVFGVQDTIFETMASEKFLEIAE